MGAKLQYDDIYKIHLHIKELKVTLKYVRKPFGSVLYMPKYLVRKGTLSDISKYREIARSLPLGSLGITSHKKQPPIQRDKHYKEQKSPVY